MEHLTKKEKRELRRLEEKEEYKKAQKMGFLKSIGMWFGLVSLIVLSLFGLIQFTNSSPSSVLSETSVKAPAVSQNDLAFGPKDAKITLIEYSDFQCPACANQHPFIKQLLNDYNGKILFVYRFFPLEQAHKNALLSAQTAYAAHQQGKFLEMEDLLFNNQTTWAENDNANQVFEDYAKRLNLDLNKFKQDQESDASKNFVKTQENSAVSLGIQSTPTMFVNGKQIQNPRNYGEFQQIVEKELNSTNKQISK